MSLLKNEKHIQCHVPKLSDQIEELISDVTQLLTGRKRTLTLLFYSVFSASESQSSEKSILKEFFSFMEEEF